MTSPVKQRIINQAAVDKNFIVKTNRRPLTPVTHSKAVQKLKTSEQLAEIAKVCCLAGRMILRGEDQLEIDLSQTSSWDQIKNSLDEVKKEQGTTIYSFYQALRKVTEVHSSRNILCFIVKLNTILKHNFPLAHVTSLNLSYNKSIHLGEFLLSLPRFVPELQLLKVDGCENIRSINVEKNKPKNFIKVQTRGLSSKSLLNSLSIIGTPLAKDAEELKKLNNLLPNVKIIK